MIPYNQILLSIMNESRLQVNRKEYNKAIFLIFQILLSLMLSCDLSCFYVLTTTLQTVIPLFFN